MALGFPGLLLIQLEHFFFLIYVSITVAIQCYVSFRCATQWLDIYLPYRVIALLSLVPTSHRLYLLAVFLGTSLRAKATKTKINKWGHICRSILDSSCLTAGLLCQVCG